MFMERVIFSLMLVLQQECIIHFHFLGDVVTLLAFNSIEWVVSFLAVLSVGAVCSTANPMYTPGIHTYELVVMENIHLI